MFPHFRNKVMRRLRYPIWCHYAPGQRKLVRLLFQSRLPSFCTAAEPNVYRRLPDGTAVLDGYPVYWTDVLTPYGTLAAPGKPLVVFGAVPFWWFGEHGMPRMDTSWHVFFQNDQLAVRFFEEIDFDYAAVDAVAVLMTPAS